MQRVYKLMQLIGTAGTEALGLQSVEINFIASTEVLDLQKVVLIAVSEELDLQ